MSGEAIGRDVLADYLESISWSGRESAERIADGAFEYARSRSLESCGPHRDAGDLPDWEARVRAAEAKLAAIAALCGEGAPAVAVDRIEAILRSGEEP